VLIDFFFQLKKAKIPVSILEFLTLLEALKQGVISPSIDAFYQLARITLIKDEQYFDRFDQAFGAYFQGIENIIALQPEIPLAWLEKQLQRVLTAEEKAALQKIRWYRGFKKTLSRTDARAKRSTWRW